MVFNSIQDELDYLRDLLDDSQILLGRIEDPERDMSEHIDEIEEYFDYVDQK